ncbi:MAG: SDR family oxidoreductase [Candidatus Limnocylindrales bacterium]
MSTVPLPRRILVTGATGTLGRHVVAALARRPDIICRALSRRPPLARSGPLVEWASVDLRSDPLARPVEDVDAVIHLASGKGGGDDDVRATGRLLEAARAGGVRHVVVISIIGCDRIPLPFYASKLGIEAVVEAAGVPWSIVRVAQFHSFVARLISTPAALPVPSPIVTDLRFQPIDEVEAAAFLVDVALGPPLGRAPELAGPETLTLGRIAAFWFAAAGRPSTLLPVPLAAIARVPAAELATPAWTLDVLSGYEAGWNTPQGDRRLGSVTFAEWLRRAGEPDPEPSGI